MYKIFGGSIVVVVFQSAFYLKIHQSNFFIFKKLILISAYQNNLKTLKIYQFIF